MAFSYYDVEGIESGFCSTSFAEVLKISAYRMPNYLGISMMPPPIRLVQSLNWNIGGGVSGTSGTSSTGGTTIVVGGSYTWIG